MSNTMYRASVIRSIVELLQILGVGEGSSLTLHVRRGYLNTEHGSVTIVIEESGDINVLGGSNGKYPYSLKYLRTRDICRLEQALHAELGKRVHSDLNIMRDIVSHLAEGGVASLLMAE